MDMPSPKMMDRAKMLTDMKKPRRVTHESGPFAFALTEGVPISGDRVILRVILRETPRKKVSIRVGGWKDSAFFVTFTQRTVNVFMSSPLQIVC
jgi:GH18 family chitinase